ncbi:glycoside hydrolase family 32 protein [Halalkalibacter urbisdiaboli]|uniref:glycoside hydrolase family 32 protein n=1 Tax=Halalkalibacter urbisdiaboli TaxID=1960589 RepID=UPI000B45429C|nr:sucrose-6-phosphate hydrolase [Halalkalibacter urbisdiaboli]
MERDKQLRKQAEEAIDTYREQVESDRYRLNYHLMPPVGLLNDPNGFVYFKGRYHLFYQWNPFQTTHGAKFWGHYSSADLIEWEHHEIALAPSDWFDKNGCYSGSAIEHDGKLYLFYTGNVKNKHGERESYQVMAVSEDGFTFEKQGVVLEVPEQYTAHFRDPKVWKHENMFYMVIGAQSKQQTGLAVLFCSKDLKNWEHLGPIAGAHMKPLADFGYMWECPDVITLNGKDVLILSPQGLEPEGILYNNLYQAGYFVGTLDYQKPLFEHEQFVELDRGFEFYAPQTTLDSKGRRLMFGWLGLPEEREEHHPTIQAHWIHAMTLPRELTLVGDKLYQRPVEELKTLRQEEFRYENVILTTDEQSFEGIEGESLEVFLTCSSQPKGDMIIQIRQHAQVIYHSESKLLTLKRVSFVDNQTIEERHCRVEGLENLRIYLDSSSLELFVNDGAEVFTARIYPNAHEKTISFSADWDVPVSISAWTLS